MAAVAYSESVPQTYYDSFDADRFYASVWGGEDIHVGVYTSEPGDTIYDASRRTVEQLAGHLNVGPGQVVLDLGSGYGGAARYLATKFGCTVRCLNISDVQNERNREVNKERGMESLVSVTHGNFEDIPFEAGTFDAVWSQDALLHSGNRPKVFQEVARVLKPGGHFVFTDPMCADSVPQDVLAPILDRLHLDALGSVSLYKKLAAENGFELVSWTDLSQQLTNHYASVREEIKGRYDDLSKVVSPKYLDRMAQGLNHWVDGGNNGHLAWGMLSFEKKAAANGATTNGAAGNGTH